MNKTILASLLAGILLAACAPPDPRPTPTPTPVEVALEPTTTAPPPSTPAPSATPTISPADEACVRATTEIPEGQNPTVFVTSGAAAGCYDRLNNFLVDIGLSWDEFVPGTVITFWTVWPVDSGGAPIAPTPTHTPIPPSPTPTPNPWVQWRVVYSITLRKHTGPTRVYMPVPIQTTCQQGIVVKAFSPDPSDLYSDVGTGTSIAYWEVTIPPGNEMTFSEEFDFATLRKRWYVDEASLPAYDSADPSVSRYLGSTSTVQTDAIEIGQAASSIVGDEANPYRQARLIFDFVGRHVTWTSSSEGGARDALGTLRTGKSECGGFAMLFVALARSAGIPARTVAGLIRLHEGTWTWPDGVNTHMWAEFYIPTFGWIPVDWADGGQFGTLEGDRLVLSVGGDIELGHGSQEGAIAFFHMPHVDDVQEEAEELTLVIERIR